MINFIFISKENKIISSVGEELTAPVCSSLNSNGERGVISRYEVNNRVKHSDLIKELHKSFGDFYSPYNGVVIFCDSDYYSYLCKTTGLFFMIFDLKSCSVDLSDGALKQRIESLISLSIKKFFQIKKTLLVDNMVLMRLPYRNFNNTMLKELYDRLKRIHEFNTSELASNIKKIKDDCYKRVPEINPGSIFVDSNFNNFIFGHEIHSRQGTSTKNGHDMLCDISSKYRFGHRLDEFRHFNVQKKTNKRISGSFFNCHNQKECVNDETHINMFTSDFMEY